MARNVLCTSAMTAPRPVFPGCFIFETRSCTQDQFILRPDKETNNNFTYHLADAAARAGVWPILSQMEANHHHTAYYDPDGRQVEFREHFHKMTAKCQNALRGRWENMWSSEEPCVVEVMTLEDLLDKLVYIATNPVKDGLVERVQHWPGPKFLHALLTGKPMKARRPRHFYRKDSAMPAELELVLSLPDHVEGKEAFLQELSRRIGEVEESYARERQRTGRRVMGRGRVLRQSWRASPSTREPRRGLRPRVASRNPLVRTLALQRNKEWQVAYADARRKLLAGLPAVFPYGTYWLRRFANVDIAPHPLIALN